MSLGSGQIFLGDQHTVPVPEGYELMAARFVDGTTERHTVTAGPDGAEFRPTALGRYYLRTRKDATENYQPAGLLVVVDVVDEGYEAVCSELETVNALLAKAGNVNSLIQYQVTTPDGTIATRMTVRALHKHRADLEARKVNFERSYSGRMPVRFS